MPDKPDNPFKFWEELKRRKVVRVIIGYAAASFIIIEVANNLTDSLHLLVLLDSYLFFNSQRRGIF